MPFANQIAGLPAGTIQGIIGLAGDGIVASGSTQSDAAQIGRPISRVSTATAGQGVQLYKFAGIGDSQVIYNDSGVALKVYPPQGQSINGGTVDAAITVADGYLAFFYKMSISDWASASSVDSSLVATYAALAASSGSSLIGFLQSGSGAVATTVQAKNRQIVSLFDFLTAAQIADVQAGTLNEDISTALQAAVDYVKKNAAFAGSSGHSQGALYVPPGKYFVTKSIDCTAASSTDTGFVIFGLSVLNTVFYSTLTEAYPVFDFTGNTLSRLKGVSLRQTGSGSETAGVLYAYVGADTVGTQGVMDDIQIDMTTCPGIVNLTDEFTFKLVRSGGTYGCISGSGNVTSITSKFRTIFATNDITRTNFSDCRFVGGVPLFLSGSVYYLMDSVYLAPTLSTSPLSTHGALVIDTSYSTTAKVNVVGRNIRFENQTASGGQDVMNCVAVLTASSSQNTNINTLDIEGYWGPSNTSGANASSSLVYSDAKAFILDLKIKGQCQDTGTYGTLNLNGNAGSITVGSVDIDTPLRTSIGTVTNKTNGRIRLAGNYSATALAALSTHNPPGEVVSGTGYGTAKHVISDYAVFPQASALVAAESGSVTIPATTNITYTGGSGDQVFLSLAVPAGVKGTSGQPVRDLISLSYGNISAALTLTVAYSDGSNTLTLTSFSVSGSGNYSLRIHAVNSGGGNLRGLAELIVNGQSPYIAQGINTSLDPASAYTITVTVSSASSNPMNFQTSSIGFLQ